MATSVMEWLKGVPQTTERSLLPTTFTYLDYLLQERYEEGKEMASRGLDNTLISSKEFPPTLKYSDKKGSSSEEDDFPPFSPDLSLEDSQNLLHEQWKRIFAHLEKCERYLQGKDPLPEEERTHLMEEYVYTLVFLQKKNCYSVASKHAQNAKTLLPDYRAQWETYSISSASISSEGSESWYLLGRKV